MGFRHGMEAKLYYQVGGIGAGSWVEMGNVKDVTLNMEASESDVTTRANNGWRAIVAALKDATIEFESVWDPEDPGFAAFRSAFLSNAVIGVRALDTADGEGLQFDAMVLNFSKTEPLEEAQGVSITLRPTYSANAPEWIEAA